MYWLIGTTIIVAMIAVLNVAAATPLPIDLWIISNSWLLPLLLLFITSALLFHKQGISLSLSPLSPSSPPSPLPPSALPSAESYNLTANHASINPTSSAARIVNFSVKSLHYFIIGCLASTLIVGSMLQALIHHQKLETSKIMASERVLAWVTIEGISDSVYDSTTSSGYRQVATIKTIAPLTAELTSEDLAKTADQYTIENRVKIEANLTIDGDNQNLQLGAQPTTQRVLLSLYPKKANDDPAITTLNNLQPGQRLLMTLSLAPLASSEQALNNPTGFDSYRWLRARHIDGVANIIAVGAMPNDSDSYPNSVSYWQQARITIDNWRWQLRQHFHQDWSNKTVAQQQAQAVTLSLLTGDRSLINRETKDLYQLAGISHLLAISGTHVLFMAIMLAALAVLLVKRCYPALYRKVPRWQVRWWVMIGSAFIYALFTGFDVPAARTAWMLLAIGAVRLTLLPISTMRVLLALAIVMAWLDPYVLWQAGFWLSFIAVALLLKYDDALQSQTSPARSSLALAKLKQKPQSFIKVTAFNNKIWLGFKRIFRLQFWLFIALLPITLLLFGKASLWGLIINLFAIGLFGWIIVPLNLLAGLFYLVAPTIADGIWTLVSTIVSQLHQLIDWLTTLPMLKSAWLYTPINIAMLLMAALVILPWLLPRGLLSRLLSLPALTLLLMTIYSNQQTFSQLPTLYILPTGDRYLSAALLTYPIDKPMAVNKKVDGQTEEKQKSSAQNKVNWLFLADHRSLDGRARPSSLTAEKLAKILEQQLRTLAVKNLQGIIVQSGTTTLTNSVFNKDEGDKRQLASQPSPAQALLPMSVAQLSQQLPIDQYWQAGRHERWSALQKQSQTGQSTTNQKPLISAQSCQQGKQWQDLSGQLTLQVLTGWSEIDDSKVWDCSVAIGSQSPIKVVHYNATDPQQPVLATIQKLASNSRALISAVDDDVDFNEVQVQDTPFSRLVLDTATDKRSWQLWSLLCSAQPFALDIKADNWQSSTWLSHSNSLVSTEVLITQQIDQVITYDEQPLEVALTMTADN